MVLPWEPNVAPEGRREGHLAIDTMAIYAPIFAPIDREAIYLVVRPYFAAGWCVRDILHAIDYRPDGTGHRDTGIAWVRGEPHDQTRARLMFRLRMWRWGEADTSDGKDIMTGPYTAMTAAMKARGEALKAEQAARRAVWDREAEHAQTAIDRGASAGARRAAEVAAVLGRQRRAKADAREADHLAQLVEAARSPYGPPADDQSA